MRLRVSFETPLVVIHKADASGSAVFTFQIGNFVFKGEHMASTMQAGTRATVSVEWKDKGGNKVKVDGPTNWVSSDPATVECSPATGNPQIANLFAPGPVGTVQIQATADADLGEGVKTVTATLDVNVIEGEAIGGDITFTPVDSKSAQKPPQHRPR
jgi:hypothetical protein